MDFFSLLIAGWIPVVASVVWKKRAKVGWRCFVWGMGMGALHWLMLLAFEWADILGNSFGRWLLDWVSFVVLGTPVLWIMYTFVFLLLSESVLWLALFLMRSVVSGWREGVMAGLGYSVMEAVMWLQRDVAGGPEQPAEVAEQFARWELICIYLGSSVTYVVVSVGGILVVLRSVQLRSERLRAFSLFLFAVLWLVVVAELGMMLLSEEFGLALWEWRMFIMFLVALVPYFFLLLLRGSPAFSEPKFSNSVC